jgi:preprotein translocase subunit YajC
MPIHLAAATALLAASSTSSGKTSAGGSAFSFLFIIVLFGLGYLLFLRPRSQQAKRQREQMQTVDVGDEVLTGAGIFGTIVEIEGDRIVLETAPGSQITVLRSTVARRLTEPEPQPAEHDEWDDDDSTPHAAGKSLGPASDGGEGGDTDGGSDPGANGRAGGGRPEQGSGEGSARAGEGG